MGHERTEGSGPVDEPGAEHPDPGAGPSADDRAEGTAAGPRAAGETVTRVVFDLPSVRRVLLLLIGAVAIVLTVQFVIEDAGTLIFQLIMGWALAVAMEPIVMRLAARGMRRGAATGLVMITAVLATIGFFALFGQLLVEQLVELIGAVPDLVQSTFDWANSRFGLDLNPEKALDLLGLSAGDIASWAASVAGGLLGVLISFIGSVFGLFTLALFTFYLSADAPRLRRWVDRFLPRPAQEINESVWDLAVRKAGGYVGARVVLALINGTTTALFLWIIGMDYWLPLGIWTGVVAQFVPTIGTYIAIALPVLIGLLSDQPIDGVLALAWGVGYQQVENLTLEPRISAKAVDLHPAVSFGAVILGASLFGVAGALLAVPVAAMVMALVETYAPRYDEEVPDGVRTAD
jgi:predicted PurR-regulated permease PerM